MTILHPGVHVAAPSDRTWRRFGILLTLVLALMLMTAGVALALTDQVIIFAELGPMTYGDPVLHVTATGGGSGNPVTFVASGGFCTSGGDNGHEISITGVGLCTVTASQAGDANYNAAPDVVRTFSITKAAQTITWTETLPERTYSSTPFTVSATGGGSTSHVIFSASGGYCTSTGEHGATITMIGVGTCTITASQAGDANYNAATDVVRTFSITKAAQTITFDQALPTLAYGAAPFTVSATGGGSTSPVTFSASGGYCTSTGTNGTTITVTGVGTCTITASQAGDANYNAATSVVRTFSITKAAQTITFAALATRTYSDAPFTVSATASSGLTVSFLASGGFCTSSGTNGATITITGVGTCTVTASQAGNANYNAATPVSQTFSITKATLTVTVVNKTKVYGEPNPTLTVVYSGFKGYETASVLTTAPTCATTAAQYSPVGGPYPITCWGGVAANYVFTHVPGYMTITRAPLTVIAADKTKVYGEPNPTLTVVYSGFKGTDTAAVLTRAPWCRTAAVQYSPVGSYPITCRGGVADNYAFTYVPGFLTVTRALPGAPLTPRGSPGSSSVRVSWLAPSFGGGAGISDYLVQYRRNGTTTWVTFPDGVSADLHAHVTGLSNGVLYQFRVAAHNSAGVGPWSAVTQMRAGVPTRPLTVVPTPGSRQVQLSWQAPASDNGAAVSDYSIQYRRNGTSTWVTFPDGVSADRHAHVTGLTNGVVYQFRVAAVNARGVGVWSIVVAAQPRA